MKGALLLSIIALCGLVSPSQGTSCKAATASTCTKSLFVTGTCTGTKCVCTNDKVAGPYGCQDQQTAKITTDLNGEAIKGETMDLDCDGEAPYVWYKGAAEHSNKAKQLQLETLDATTHDGAYTCKGTFAGVLSKASNAVTVKVVDDKNGFTTKPVVTGMPTKAVTGQKVTLTCTNIPLTGVTAYVWAKGGTPVAGKTGKTMDYTFVVGDAAAAITCQIDGVKSTEAKTPAALAADDITKPEIQGDGVKDGKLSTVKGQKVVVTCDLGGFPEDQVNYEWKKDNVALTPPGTTKKLTIAAIKTTDAGTYTCEAKFAAKAAIPSTGVAVTVTEDLKATGVKASPDTVTKFLNTGYYVLTCPHEPTDHAVTYKWFKDDAVLPGVTDKVLQFNEPKPDTDGAYKCSVTSTAGTATTATALTFTAVDVAKADKPTLTASTADFVIGEEVTFTCTSAYYTPGMTYEWTPTTDPAETSDTFKYKPTTDAVDVKCKYSFGVDSSADSTAIAVKGEAIKSVEITANGRKGLTALTPVQGSKVTFSCLVEKAPSAGDVTYQWKKGNTNTVTTKDYELTIPDNTKTITIDCKATIGSDNKDAAQVTVTPATTAAKPIITSDKTMTPIRGDTVALSCDSASVANGAVYEWKKGTTVLSSKTYQHKFSPIAKTDDGDYTCKITVGGKTSVASNAVTLATEADEVACTKDSDCTAQGAKFGKCESKKCTCVSGYSIKLQKCEKNSAASVIGSLMLLISSVLALRFL